MKGIAGLFISIAILSGGKKMSRVAKKKLSSGFPNKSDTNRAVQAQMMVRGLKFRIKEVEGLYCTI